MAEMRCRALVVDDEPCLREVAMLELEENGLECEEASNGAQALKLLGRCHFDAVVTDLRMPTMHGHALAVELLSRRERPIVFVVTAVEDPRMASDLLARGVDDIFIKPVSYPLLAVKLKHLFKKRSPAERAKV